MSWCEVLLEKKNVLLDKWFDLALREYSPEATRFFKQERDRFANPIGYTLREGLENLFGELVGGSGRQAGSGPDQAKIAAALAQIVRVMATQELRPSRTLAVILGLKNLIHELLDEEIRGGRVSVADVAGLDALVDEMALAACDLYMDCRQKIMEIRVNDIRNRTYRLLQKANLLAEETEG